tara:strand:- start:3927 stop:4751 length:825 start_codon:yes stop_codon:yes gene_type:complete
MFTKKPSLIIIFYGIGRNPKSVIKNLNLIKKNLQCSYEITSAYAINKIKYINNPRTNEFNYLNQKELKRSLTFIDIFFEKDQEIFEESFKKIINKFNKNFIDPYNDKNRTLCNLYCQLNLLTEFLKLKSIKKYQLIFTIRDDIIINKYFGLFRMSKLLFKYPKHALTTSYHWHNGVNDRILIFGQNSRKIFSLRLKKYKEALKDNSFSNSEKINMEALKSMGIKIISSPFEVLRVRSNGKIRKEIFLIRFYRINETIRVFKSIILYLKILIFRK